MATSIIIKPGYAPRVDGTIGDDTLVGAATLKNAIYGGAGDDLIIGGSAGDALVGEAGNDTVIGGAGNDGIWGGGGNDSLSGGAGNDTILGDGGNDTLDGGLGADTLAGGIGDDAYIVDDIGDIVVENAGEGVDIVRSSITYALTANVENLILTGTANIDGTGNGLDNVLTGNAGDNVLDGGLGADTMAGGAGNDTYIVANAGDVVIELAGAGIDTVKTQMSYTLGANVENLTLMGTANLVGTGNALDNVLMGNSGNDSLYGGAGRDALYGGQGNDFLNGGADADILFGGAGNDGFFGGGGNDTISGGDGHDRVYGDGGGDLIQGGLGNDTMTGGAINGLGDKGANTYVWDKGDVVKADGTSAGLDRITDFGAGDKLDFSGLFKGTASSDPGLFLHVADTTSGTVISADVGAGHFIDVVVLDNVHNVTLDDLLLSHAIVV